MKRGIELFISVCLFFSMVQIPAFAEETIINENENNEEIIDQSEMEDQVESEEKIMDVQEETIDESSIALLTGNTAQEDSYIDKVNSFINDTRWANGVSWTSTQKPKLSSYGAAACVAYAADFVKYVFGASSPTSGTRFTNVNEIRAGDIIHLSFNHWVVVLYRDGDMLYTAEGNFKGTVKIKKYGYQISNGGLMQINTSSIDGPYYMDYGYHFTTAGFAPEIYEKESGALIDSFKGSSQSGTITVQAQRTGSSDDYYGKFYMDGKSITDELKCDANGFFTTQIDTAQYTNGEHVLAFEYVYTKGSNVDTLTIRIDNEDSVVEFPQVSYATHVQNYGWQDSVTNGHVSGTSGESKRLEAIQICATGVEGLGIAYTTHVQNYGWLNWSSNGDVSGTSGESKRLEAIQIQLTVEKKDKYDVYYRVHAQDYGWLNWAKNGQSAGTSGYSKRLEAIQIVVVEKGDVPTNKYLGIESANNKAYIAKSGSDMMVNGVDAPNVYYRTHVQIIGWQNWKSNGQMAGTTGQSKRLEGIELYLTNKQYEGSIQYRTHVQNYGWMDYVNEGNMSGTTAQSKRLEAIQIHLTGEMANQYDIYYRVHAQNVGWMDWAKNGEKAGTAGFSYRLEGIEVKLVKKGEPAPGSTKKPFVEK